MVARGTNHIETVMVWRKPVEDILKASPVDLSRSTFRTTKMLCLMAWTPTG